MRTSSLAKQDTPHVVVVPIVTVLSLLLGLTGCQKSTGSIPTDSASASITSKGILEDSASGTVDLANVVPSLCAIQDDLDSRRISAAGGRFANETHNMLHALVPRVTTENQPLGEKLEAAKLAFENEAFTYRVTMADYLPDLIAATSESVRMLDPSLPSQATTCG